MPNQEMPQDKPDNDSVAREPQADAPIPTASEDEVLDETARLAREGQRELKNDPKEAK